MICDFGYIDTFSGNADKNDRKEGDHRWLCEEFARRFTSGFAKHKDRRSVRASGFRVRRQ
jgi:hypothetical protein